MRSLPHQPTLVDQVYEAILSEISAGKYGPDSRLIQEELAEALGVSRQPVQQALLILRSQGLLRDAPGRGLMVAPLDADHVRNVYEIREMIDGLASSKAAERGREIAGREGPAFIASGRAAVASGSIPRMIAADMDFHYFLYGLSGNPLIPEVSAVHWSHLRRVMGEVLQHGEPPNAIWDQHEAILDAVIAGDAAAAERLARHHIAHAGEALAPRVGTTGADDAPTPAASRGRRSAKPAATASSPAAAKPVAKARTKASTTAPSTQASRAVVPPPPAPSAKPARATARPAAAKPAASRPSADATRASTAATPRTKATAPTRRTATRPATRRAK